MVDLARDTDEGRIESMATTVLVVGGTGATGIPLVRGLCARGYEVTIFHRGLHEKGVPQELEHIHADPHWPESIEAALAGRSFDIVVATYGRLRLLAEALKGKTHRLISAGGALPIYKGWMRMTEVYPWASMEDSPALIEESHPLAREPVEDSFSLRAREAEHAVLCANAEGHFAATHFRYPIVYGPYSMIAPEWPIIRRVREGRRQIILPGGGATLLSRGYGENVAHAILLAVDKPDASAGEIYNVCDERPLSNAQWARTVLRLLDADVALVDIPYALLPKHFRSTPTQLLFPKHRLMSIERLKTQLGYRDPYSAEAALERSVRWLLENPVEIGGEIEQNIQDSFDYALEDAVIERFTRFREAMGREWTEFGSGEFVWRHPYPHPKQRGDER